MDSNPALIKKEKQSNLVISEYALGARRRKVLTIHAVPTVKLP